MLHSGSNLVLQILTTTKVSNDETDNGGDRNLDLRVHLIPPGYGQRLTLELSGGEAVRLERVVRHAAEIIAAPNEACLFDQKLTAQQLRA